MFSLLYLYGKVRVDALEKITLQIFVKVFIRRIESCELVASNNYIKINNLGEVCCHMLAGICFYCRHLLVRTHSNVQTL